MNRKREKLQAYFAGLFDGEGSVGIYGNNAYERRLVLHVTMTESLAVMLLHAEYPEATCFVKDNLPSRRRQYVFQLQGYTAYRFLHEIKPYCIIKHEQVSVALSYLVHRRRERALKFHHSKDCNNCVWFEDKVKELKIPDNGVNSVNTWPNKSREYRAKLADAEHDVQVMVERLEGVETRHRAKRPVEAISAPEKDIVQV